MAQALKVVARVDGHLLARRPPVRLRPLELSRVELHLEKLVAFAAAKVEDLAVVPDEHHALPGVSRAGADVAGFDTHGLAAAVAAAAA